MSDLATESMFWVLGQQPELGEGGRVLFLRARPHQGLSSFAGRMQCEQAWRPDAEALEAMGWAVQPELVSMDTEPVDLILLRPNRQREQVLFDLARALRLLRKGGRLVVAMSNDTGAGRYLKRLREALGTVEGVSKKHSRVFWTVKDDSLNEALLDDWLAGGEERPLLDGAYWSRPGCFSWDRVDSGSRLLTECLPESLGGRVVDLGSGWGYVSRFLLENRRQLRSLDYVEGDWQALDLTRRNLEPVETRIKTRGHWLNAAKGIPGIGPFDAVVMNPPFHDGRTQDIQLGRRFIEVAWEALADHGELWMVANKHLPYERVLRELFSVSWQVREEGGFKVLAAAKHGGTR